MYSEIKSFEDACSKLGIGTQLPDVAHLREKNQKSTIANYKLDVINEAINDGWIPAWQNSNQRKYNPVFKMSSPSGAGFSFACCDYWNTLLFSGVGSRRVFETSDKAIYCGTQFTELYRDAIL